MCNASEDTGPTSRRPGASAPIPATVPPLSTPGGDQPLRGVVLLLSAMMIVPLMDGIAKYLSSEFHTLQIVWSRFFFHFMLLAPIVLWRLRPRDLLPPRPILQLLRGGCLLAATIVFFWSLRTMPLANTLAIFFVAPMLVTMLSALILREHVGIRRWSAVLIGFAGVLIIARPGSGLTGSGVTLAFAAAAAYALYAIATRYLSGTAPPLVTLAYTALLGAIVMSVAAVFVWKTPTAAQWALMAAIGVIAAGGHYLLIRAYELAPASLLAPYGYAEIVMATIVGYVVFGDFPDGWTWAGIAVIVSGGIYISIRERQLGRG